MKTSIAKNSETKDSQDFLFLREKGMEYIRELSGRIWTDHNSHDPGITLLEALCYAITDLGYRIHLPIRDILTETKETDLPLESRFPSPKRILTSGPVTPTDYRKLLLDIDGVHNVFVRKNRDYQVFVQGLDKRETTPEFPLGKLSFEETIPSYKKLDSFVVNGLYNILYEPDPELEFLEEEEKNERLQEIEKNIRLCYHTNRNLCEDVVEIREIELMKILVCGDISLDYAADPTETLVELLFRIQEYLSPSIKRYTLRQLLKENTPVEDIFNGPVLEKGFIKDEELENADLKTEIHLSDLVQIVLETPGIVGIENLRMGECGEIEEDTQGVDQLDQWKICFTVDHDKALSLCLDQSIRLLNLFKDVVPLTVDLGTVKKKLEERLAEYRRGQELTYDDLPMKKGTGIDLATYRTVQNELPQIYGTGEVGLSPDVPEERKVKALQLKGYLLFFDQVLASYFAHLENVKNLLSAQNQPYSYYPGEIGGVKDLEKLVGDYGRYEKEVAELLNKWDDNETRRNKFLDHLLARFAEEMNQYVFALQATFGGNLKEAALEHKRRMLKDYPELSYNRAKGFVYYGKDLEVWDTENVSGLKRRLSRLLGFKNEQRTNLTLHNFKIGKTEDTPPNWIWNLTDKEGNPILKATQGFPENDKGEERDKAEGQLWDLLDLMVDASQYRVQFDSETERYSYELVDKNETILAQSTESYEAEEDVRKAFRKLSESIEELAFREGMFLFEHVLFRPDKTEDPPGFMEITIDAKGEFCEPIDPYSMRVTIVLPGWFGRFADMDYRKHADKVIRSEVPAHILPRICWVGHTLLKKKGDESQTAGTLAALEEAYQKWLIEKMKPTEMNTEEEVKARKNLLTILENMKTVYPTGRLHDCAQAEAGDIEKTIVLGRSRLGELKNKDHEQQE